MSQWGTLDDFARKGGLLLDGVLLFNSSPSAKAEGIESVVKRIAEGLAKKLSGFEASFYRLFVSDFRISRAVCGTCLRPILACLGEWRKRQLNNLRGRS